jgi:hypothetical protein
MQWRGDLSGNKWTNKEQGFDQTFVKMKEALRQTFLRGYPVRVAWYVYLFSLGMHMCMLETTIMFIKEKVYFTPPTMRGGLLQPPTMKSSILLPEFFKTSQITTSSGFGRWVATVTMVCCGNCGFVFFFLFYLFWFNLWKIIVNYKKIIK